MTARQPWLGIKTRDWFINSDTPQVEHQGRRRRLCQVRVRKWFLDRHDIHQAGGKTTLEYWIEPKTATCSTPTASARLMW
jgi:hypothetical protein